MDNLVLNDNGRAITTSLLVAEKFEKQPKNVNQAIKDILGLAENSADLFTESRYTDSYGRLQFCYTMGRDGFSLLVMGFTGQKALQFKLDFIAAFNKMEEALRKIQTPQTFAEALRLAADQQELIEKQKKQLQYQEPRVRFAEAVEASDRSILIGELAKILKQNGIEIGQNRLFGMLRNAGYLGSRGEYYNIPTQKAMDLGLFEIKKQTINKPDGTVLVSTTTKVTGKGSVYFTNKFLKKQAEYESR